MNIQAVGAYKKKSRRALVIRIKQCRVLYLMMLPGIVLLLLLHYWPMIGLLLSFKEFSFSGNFLSGKWVGLKNFQEAFTDPFFLNALRNTFSINFWKLLFGFPLPIIFALMLNELPSKAYKRGAQAVSFLPYFVSWVVLTSIFTTVMSLEGPVNKIIELFGGTASVLLANSKTIVQLIVTTAIWQVLGWNSIIYTAALAGVDPQLYEAAVLDGAGKLRQIWNVSLPSITSVIVIMLILDMGTIINSGFEQIFNMMNPVIYDKIEIIDTYVYKKGIQQMNYPYAAAVGLFKSVVSLTFVLVANYAAGKIAGKENTLL